MTATPTLIVTTVIGVPACQLVWFVHVGRYLGTHPVEYYAVGNAVHACQVTDLRGRSVAILGTVGTAAVVELARRTIAPTPSGPFDAADLAPVDQA